MASPCWSASGARPEQAQLRAELLRSRALVACLGARLLERAHVLGRHRREHERELAAQPPVLLGDGGEVLEKVDYEDVSRLVT
mgnify:CR=1 FL=1